MKARIYSVIRQAKGHILFTTQTVVQDADYIHIPRVIPKIMDPFILWYSLTSGKGVNSFTVKTENMSFTLNRTNDLQRLEPILRDDPKEQDNKIIGLAEQISFGLQYIDKEDNSKLM
jgi:hypothetical protein